MDDHEREHLIQHIRSLERANRAWKATTGIVALALALFFVVLGTFSVLQSFRARSAMQEALAQQAVRAEAEMARQEAVRQQELAKQRAREAKEMQKPH